jgi:hypothetical protein
MTEERRRSPRWYLLPVSGLLLLGCVLVPVDESRFGSPQALRFSPDHAPYKARDIVFSHDLHASLSCDKCHFGTVSGEESAPPEPATNAARGQVPGATAEVALPAMALCLDCHDGKSVPNDCITCHVTNRKERKPGFHDGLFPRQHKHMAEEEAYKCGLCHIQSECKACHAERKPVSHTPRFARSTHGRMATHERRSCATCHETSFCENCHSEPPPNHTIAWTRGGGHKQAALIRGRSCLVCHRFQDACAECHG